MLNHSPLFISIPIFKLNHSDSLTIVSIDEKHKVANIRVEIKHEYIIPKNGWFIFQVELYSGMRWYMLYTYFHHNPNCFLSLFGLKYYNPFMILYKTKYVLH